MAKGIDDVFPREATDKLMTALDELTRRARPYVPFTAMRTVCRELDGQTGSLLDVGCGKGETFQVSLGRKGFDAIGVDIFRPAIEECRRSKTHRDLVQGDVTSLPFKDKSFDIAISLEVLEHLEREGGEKMLREMERVARKQVILTTPLGRYRQGALEGNPHQVHRHLWSPHELKALGYRVRTLGLRGVGGENGLASRLPGPLRLLADGLYVLAGPITRFVPSLAGEMVCSRRLKNG